MKSMTVKEYDSLDAEDFHNGAVLDEIRTALKENEEFQELHESFIDIILDLYDQIEQKNEMTVARTRYWADILSKNMGDCRGLIEEIVKEIGGEVIEG